ncbi:hypothetical protein evm_003464 [Chilo suppressalis]|nr:hypothetical protein evm_003464 [Chilo suppressalis]
MRYIICALIVSLLITTLYLIRNELIKNAYGEHEAAKTDVYTLNSFIGYMKKFNKSYTDCEFMRRMRNYEKSVQEIRRLNTIHDSKVFGLTKFSDWADDEFSAFMLSGRSERACKEQSMKCLPKRKKYQNFSPSIRYMMFKNRTIDVKISPTYGNIPVKIDWRDFGVVSPVLNQKLCSACWAFSIVGVMESMVAIYKKGLTRLSIQELIDCSKYNNGCHMGDIRLALQFLCQNDYPIVTEKEYSLTLRDESCRIPDDQKPNGERIAEYANLCNVDEKKLLKLIAMHGPVVASVNAAPWRYYIGGVIKSACPLGLVLAFLQDQDHVFLARPRPRLTVEDLSKNKTNPARLLRLAART